VLLFVREIHGVPFLCAVDDKECPYDLCYDEAVWDDDSCDMIIPNPLPDYRTAIKENYTSSTN
jgi:hypothetical protein